MQLKIGDTTTIDGQLMRYVGDGKFDPVVIGQAGDLMAKRFDAGGPLSGQPVVGGHNAP